MHTLGILSFALTFGADTLIHACFVLSVLSFSANHWLSPLAFRAYNALATSPSLIRHLQARNIRVIFWVLNHEEDFDIAFAAGADGVMTDKPSMLIEYLRRGKHIEARERGPFATGNKTRAGDEANASRDKTA